MNKRLALFPVSTQVQQNELFIGGCSLTSLAEQFGTPLYLYDKADLDSAASRYRRALGAFWPGQWSVTYAGKAFLSIEIAKWAAGYGFSVDCTGLGEIGIAVQAGVAKEQILVHGVNKSREDLSTAIEKTGTIVVDNLSELKKIAKLRKNEMPNLWLRFQPGLAVETHAYTQTGHSESKFGMGRETLFEAVHFCRSNDLPLAGIHFHQGSQFRDPAPLAPAIDAALELAAEIGFGEGWHLSPGGGWGMAYHEDELPHPSIEDYVQFVAEKVQAGCQKHGLALPHLHLEPGRSLVAKAGVALYRVGTVKHSGGRTWVLVDGGLADNPRPALYGARYSALTATKVTGGTPQVVFIAGPYCESGDVLIEGIELGAVEEGDLIAIPMSGAYHISMSSNYNGARRPAVVMVENGQAHELLRRENTADLFRRDV
jgi:diaminopimelate decarboxylase